MEDETEKKAGWVLVLRDAEKDHTHWTANWKKRWMVITATSISFYVKEHKDSKKGSIACDIIQNVRAIADHKGKQHVFKIGTKLGTYIVSVGSDEERSSWIAAIQAVNSNAGRKNALLTGVGGVGVSMIGTALVSTFEKIKVIGTGGFSTVYLVRKQGSTNKYYAMKVIKEGDMKQKNMEQEIRIMARINNPFLVKLHVSFKTQKYLYFVMDFVNGGGLYYYLEQYESLDEERSKFYTAEILCGLEYLHSRGIVYRDLKPENILINYAGHIVLTDFGLSKTGLVNKDAKTNTRCGTPYYVAPEIILGEEYTKAVDFWSLGVVLYEMLFGVPPFYSEEAMGIYKKIVMNDYTIDSDQITEECQNFIESLLAEDPNTRLTDVEEIKRHAFFRGYDWEKLKRQELTPPYVPKVHGPDDTQFFDSEVLSFPIEHDDTEVSEYSDWTLSMQASDVSYNHEANGNGSLSDLTRVTQKTPQRETRSAATIPLSPVSPPQNLSATLQTLGSPTSKILPVKQTVTQASSASETNAPSDSFGSDESKIVV
jgi:serine/threonine protein kinase